MVDLPNRLITFRIQQLGGEVSTITSYSNETLSDAIAESGLDIKLSSRNVYIHKASSLTPSFSLNLLGINDGDLIIIVERKLPKSPSVTFYPKDLDCSLEEAKREDLFHQKIEMNAQQPKLYKSFLNDMQQKTYRAPSKTPPPKTIVPPPKMGKEPIPFLDWQNERVNSMFWDNLEMHFGG